MRNATMRKRMFHLFHSDERGSALTEFVIGLPVYIILFLGILNLHQLEHGAVLVKAEAHALMWDEAIDMQTSFMPDWAMQPALAAGEAVVFHNQTGGSALDYVLDGENLLTLTGVSGGTMLESFTRVGPVDIVENIGEANGLVTWDINKEYLVENPDSITNDLLNDGMAWGKFSEVTGNGVLGGLNSIISISGMRPAIAAGARYGIAKGKKDRSINMMGTPDVTLQARSHVANPPRATSRYITFAVVRLAMAKEDRYDTAIAFEWMPEFAGGYEQSEADYEDYQNCQQANADAVAAGEPTTDCGDDPSEAGADAGQGDERDRLFDAGSDGCQSWSCFE